jgi:glycosyltransferase involved in cell wall biosynthesis
MREETKARIHVQLFYGWDADRYRQNYIAGKKPDESPYGFHLAREEGFDVTFSRDCPRDPNSLLMQLVGRLLGFDLLHAWFNRELIRAADVIWVMSEDEAFATAFLFSLRIVPRRPIVANAIWLANYWKDMRLHKKLIYRYLARYISILTVHSNSCLPIVKSAFPRLRAELMYFGINTNIFKLTTPILRRKRDPTRIFAPGRDRTRDWGTLLAAFGNDDRFQLTIICSRLTYDQIRQYRNVVLVDNPTMAEFLDCYREADMVAVSMKENNFAGITVALEAVAMGKPVVSSRTGGVTSYFEEEDVFFVPVGDASAMREVVLSSDHVSRHQRAESAQRRFVARDYSTRALIRRYSELTREMLSGISGNPSDAFT